MCFFFFNFPLMTEAFQPSERGSLVETSKNWSGKLAKSLGSLRSAGGERRWELRGQPSMALPFSRKQKNPSPQPPLCQPGFSSPPPHRVLAYGSRPQGPLCCQRASRCLHASPAAPWHPARMGVHCGDQVSLSQQGSGWLLVGMGACCGDRVSLSQHSSVWVLVGMGARCGDQVSLSQQGSAWVLAVGIGCPHHNRALGGCSWGWVLTVTGAC